MWPAVGRSCPIEARLKLLFPQCRRVAPLLSLFVLAPDADAQALRTSLDEVVVTATRAPQQLNDVLPSTTVITRSQIEARQQTDLVELLGRVAGVQFARSGGAGSQTGLFVRGAGSSQVLVLIDGVRINSVLSAGPVLGGIALDAIERVEVVRGNLSSLYGSEAIGGVVQIFTRAGTNSGASARVEAGSGDERAVAAAATQHWQGASLTASVAARRSAPFSAIDPAQVVAGPFALGVNPDIDRHRQRNGSLRFSLPLTPAIEIGASAWGSHNDTAFDSTADGAAATHDEDSTQTVMQAYGRIAPSDRFSTRLQVSQARDRTENVSSNPFSFNNGRFDARTRTVTLSNHVRVAEAVTATIHLEHAESRGASTSYDPTFSGVLTSFRRRVDSAQFGATGAAGAQRVQLSARHDEYSDVGSATTGLIAYGYDLSPRWRATAQVGSAFRAPGFNDLYFPGFGNPALEPERARSAEVGLRFAHQATLAQFSVYRTDTDNLIAFDFATRQAQNIARARAEGIEVSLRTRWMDTDFEADASVTRAIDRRTDERLLRRAPVALHLAVRRSFGRFDAGIEASRVGAREDSDINTFARTTLASYSIARLLFGWRVNEHVQLKLRVENVFDEDYELVDGYNTPRRGVFAAVMARI